MAQIEFVEHEIIARLPELTNPANHVDVPLSIRVDPLLGHTSRVMNNDLTPSQRGDLDMLVAPPSFCPFCADTIEQATGTLPSEVIAEGRIRRGQAVIVPNVVAYSQYSTVGLYDTRQHFLDLPELTPTRVGDLLEALVEYTTAVQKIGPFWSSINANYLPPSGSSVVHPHAQSVHDEFGTTMQRAILERSSAWNGTQSFWQELIDAERDGPRWLNERGRVAFMTPFAPVGFHEVWAVVQGCSDISRLTPQDCADLGAGLSGVLDGYYSLNLASFNWALYGAGPAETEQYSLLMRIVSRSNPDTFYRSDVTYFEKLHQEAVTDMLPEALAERLRGYVT